MKVAELIDQLKDMPMNREVFLSTDSEGNYFGSLVDVEDSAWHDGEPVHPDDADGSEPRVVVLWPS